MPPKKTDKPTRSSKEDSFQHARRVTIIGIVVAVLFLVSAYYAYQQFLARSIGVPHFSSPGDRFAFVLRYQLPGLLWVVISLAHVGIIRFRTAAINPLSGNEAVIEKANHILVNTFEQFVVSAINQLIFATFVGEERLRLIPLISFFFFIGRLAFFVGYLINPLHRAFGFALTWIPSVALTGYNTYFFLVFGPHSNLAAAKQF